MRFGKSDQFRGELIATFCISQQLVYEFFTLRVPVAVEQTIDLIGEKGREQACHDANQHRCNQIRKGLEKGTVAMKPPIVSVSSRPTEVITTAVRIFNPSCRAWSLVICVGGKRSS